MTEEMTPFEKVHQAFYQLSFVIKLLPWFEQKKISKSEFDGRHVVRLEKHALVLKANMFNTAEDLVVAVHNAHTITLGFTAITMDVALQEAGAPKKIDGTNDSAIAALVRLIRCAFAHNMMHPVWKISREYPNDLKLILGGTEITIPLQQLNGAPFNPDAFGGLENYFKLRDEVLEILRRYGLDLKSDGPENS
jgi:hypothetical protein